MIVMDYPIKFLIMQKKSHLMKKTSKKNIIAESEVDSISCTK